MAGLLPRPTPAAPGIRAEECWLIPFREPPRPRSLRARVRWTGSRLTVRYVLEGELDDLVLPAAALVPRRQDGLWQASCFEAFLSCPSQSGYREINLAPAGHWAAYFFEAPRQGMRLEAGLDQLDWKTHRVPGHFAIRFSVRPDNLGLEGTPLRLGLCAILKRQDGEREFWALHHPSAGPDFHHPAGHLLELSDRS